MIQADELNQPGLRHGFFTRLGGVSDGIYSSLNTGRGSKDDQACVAENRQRVARQLGVDPDNLVSPYQVHSPDVLTVNASWSKTSNREADALVTATPGLAIGVSTADCGPVLFADAKAGVIGAAHSGWKGAVTGVLENTIRAMEALGAERSRTTAVLGPMISQNAYEVGPEFKDRFVSQRPKNSSFFRVSERPRHHYFDLPAFILESLAASGIDRRHSLDLCTYGDEERFYSYRRTTHRGEPDYGRLISAIVLTRE